MLHGNDGPVFEMFSIRHGTLIGSCPPDEYDAYAGKIASLVKEGASDDVLRDYLRWAEAEHMRLGKPDAGRLSRTLTAIHALGPVS